MRRKRAWERDMVKFQSRPLLGLLGVLVISGLVLAAVASATCGGKEEASWSLLPAAGSTALVTGIGTTASITIDNTGGATIEGGPEALNNGNFAFVSGCAGAIILPGNSCTFKVKCVAKGSTFLTVSVVGAGELVLTLKCD